MNTPPSSTQQSRHRRKFATTRWSLVLQAKDVRSTQSQMALAELCEGYWLPLYTFIRRQTLNVDEAQDLTQAFFTQLLSKDYLQDVRPTRGRFRSFLLAAVKHFLSNERDKAAALKRGGAVTLHSLDWNIGEQAYQNEVVNNLTPERLFERKWAMALLERVLDRLKQEQATTGKASRFDVLSEFLTHDRTESNFASAASQLNMSVQAVRVATHRLRKRYRQLLREEIAQTTQSADEVEDELKCLFAALANPGKV